MQVAHKQSSKLIIMRKYVFLLVLSTIIINNASSQNVGIGTNTPSAKLDVNGNLRIRTIPAGVAADSYLTVDQEGNIRKSSSALQSFIVIDRGVQDETYIGEPGSLYQFNDPVENPEDGYGILNFMPGATITREYIPGATGQCLGVRVPEGVYQVTMTYTGFIPPKNSPSDTWMPSPDFFNFFYSTPAGADEGIYGQSYNTVPSKWGFRGSISLIMGVSGSKFFPFNLGWGVSEAIDTGREITLSWAQLCLIKLR